MNTHNQGSKKFYFTPSGFYDAHSMVLWGLQAINKQGSQIIHFKHVRRVQKNVSNVYEKCTTYMEKVDIKTYI